MIVVLYVLSFLAGVCSLHFFSELPGLKSSMCFIVFLLVLAFLLEGFSKRVLKTIDYNFRAVSFLIKLKYFSFLKHHSNLLFWLSKHLALTVLAFALGYLWMWLHIDFHLSKKVPAQLEGEAIQVVGTIVSLPESQNEGIRFEFDIKQTIPNGLWTNPGKVLLSYYDSRDQPFASINRKSFKVGDEWQFWVKLKKPRCYSNPGSFDKEKYYFQNRWQAQGRILLKLPKKKLGKNKDSVKNNSNNNDDNNSLAICKGHKPSLLNSSIDCSPKKIKSDWFSCPIHRLRAMGLSKIRNVLENKPFCALITALVFGVREGITETEWQVFRDTGTAHLMAISGLHIGLVASVVYFLMQFIWRFLPQSLLIIPATWVSALMAILGSLIYALLAGFSIPTQRALVMITLFMFSTLLRRMGNAWRTYFISLMLVVLFDPFSTLSVGFWLSFSAVAMILYGIKGRLQPSGIWWKWGRAQWVVFLGLMPITLGFFKQLSLVSPFANILAIPWVSFTVVPPALLGTALLFISESAGSFCLRLAEFFFSLLWPVLEFFAKMSKATWMPLQITGVSLVAAFLGCLILLVPRGFPGRFLGVIGLLPLFLATPITPSLGTAKFTLLDVGQGLAAVLQTNQHVLLFDTGPKFGEGSDTGARVILPFLENQGIKKIDAIVISHGDNDHIGGLISILQKMTIGTILTSERKPIEKIYSKLNNISYNHLPEIKPCYAGQKWHWDGVLFEMIHPDTKHNAKRNDMSCVLKIKVGAQSVLLTADIEQPSEMQILEKYQEKLASSILVVPHHGSKTSSSLEFIQAVHPAYALIPVGYMNPYGHPKPDILDRYRYLNIPILDSVNDGAISFVLEDKAKVGLPETYRFRGSSLDF